MQPIFVLHGLQQSIPPQQKFSPLSRNMEGIHMHVCVSVCVCARACVYVLMFIIIARMIALSH